MTELDQKRAARKVKDGVVVSNKMDKTVAVVVQETKTHPQYRKFIRRQSRFMAHDETNECGIGDRVRITETRPLSKEKRWRVSTILEKAK